MLKGALLSYLCYPLVYGSGTAVMCDVYYVLCAMCCSGDV